MKFNKKTKIIFVIVLIAIIAVGGYFLYDYLKKQRRINEIEEYKKGFYEGMLCEYNCPMTAQEYKNKTQMLPELDCIKNCTGPFKARYSNMSFTKEELERDNLLNDIDNAIKNCKKESVNMTTLTLNNTAYFNCAAENLDKLSEKYEYLNQ